MAEVDEETLRKLVTEVCQNGMVGERYESLSNVHRELIAKQEANRADPDKRAKYHRFWTEQRKRIESEIAMANEALQVVNIGMEKTK